MGEERSFIPYFVLNPLIPSQAAGARKPRAGAL